MKKILLFATALMLAVSSIFAQCDAPTNVSANALWNKVKLTWESALSQTPTFDGTISYQPNVIASGVGYDAAGIFSAVVRFPADSLTAHSGMYLTHVGFVPYALTLNRVTVRIRQGGSYVGGTFDPGNVVSTTTVPVDNLQAGVVNTIHLTTPVLVDPTQELWIECEIEATSGFPGAVGSVAHPTYNDLIYDATDGWDYLDNLGLTDYGWLIEGYFEADPSPIVGFNVLRDNVQINTSMITGHSFVDNDVQTEQQYCYTVQTLCDTDGINTASADPVCVTTPEEPNCSSIIGNGTGSTYYIPVNPFYKYSYSQQIFSAAEISSTPGTIVSAAFQYFYASPLDAYHVEVYMANISQSTFSSSSNWIPGSSLTQVYSGPLTFTNTGDSSLVNIDFDNAFEWDGHSNVVLAVKYDQGEYYTSDPRFYTHTTTGNKAIYVNTDGGSFDINNPGSGSLMSSRNNVKFCLGPAPSCFRPGNLQVSNLTSESANITWQPAYDQDSEWEIVVVPTGTPVTDGIAETVYDTTYSALSLDANTAYDVYVRTSCGGGEYSEWSMISFRTSCVSETSFPYMEDFSGYGTAADAFPFCWTRETNYSTAYPYITSNFQLYFYSYSNYYSRAITHGFDFSEETPGSLALSFLIGKASDNYGRMDIGYITDPNDMSTYQLLKSYFPSDYQTTGFFQQEIIELPASVYNQTVYFVFEAPAPVSYTTNYVNMKNVAIGPLPECSNPTHLSVGNITGTAASLSWTAAPYGADDYTVEYGESGMQSFTPIIVSGTSIDITGLTNGTSYDVLLYSNCQSGASDTLTTTFSTIGCFAVSTDTTLMTRDTVGNGTSSSSYLPSYSFYNYGYSQQIYKASEIQGAGYISAIALNAVAITQQRIYDIYMMHTDVAASASWLAADNAQLVYTGTLNLTTGWNTFNFTNPFFYNGTNNLVLIMIDKTGAYVSGNSWQVHNGGSNCSRYAYQDGSQYDTHSTPSGSVSSTSDRNNIIFTFAGCDDNVTCMAPVVTVTGYDDENITISWLPGNAESSWEVEYKLATDNNWNSEGVVNATTHTFTGLTSGESYNIRVRANCSSSEQSDWTTVNAFTICTPIATLPFTENFENSNDYPECWMRLYSGSTATPTVSTSFNYTTNGSHSLNFDVVSNSYAYAILPRFDNDIEMDNLLIQFATYKVSDEYFIQVGVMSDPEDANSFESIGTFSPSQTYAWEEAEFASNNYNGNGHYLAFRIPAWLSNYIYIDDIYVEEIPSCMHVSNIHAVGSSITPYSADVTWTPGGEETSWQVVYGPAGTITDPDNETSSIENSNTVSLSGLNANTLYEVYVKALCGGGDESNWYAGYFRTGCAAMTLLPYEDNLDSYVGSTSTYDVLNNLPSCWDYHSASIYDPYTQYPILYSDAAYAASGSNSLYFYTYASYDYGDQIAILPEIDTQTYPMNSLQVEFAARCAYDDSYTTFQVVVGVMSGTNVSTFQPIDTITTESSVYADYDVSLIGYTGSGNRIAFKITPPNDGMNDNNEGYIDNIVILEQPTCPRPSEIHLVSTSTGSVELGWTSIGQESSWNIEYGPTGFTHGNGDIELATTNPFTLTNLTDTVYDFYVQADCGGEQSLWRGPLTLRPNTYNMQTTGSDTLTMCGGHIYDDGGISGAYSNNANSIVIVRPDQPGMLAQVQGSCSLESGWDYLYIYDGEGTNGDLLWSSNLVSGSGNVPLIESTVGALTIQLTSDVSNTYDGFDLAVSCIQAPTCMKPVNIVASASTTTDITLSWTEMGSATQWNIEYGPAGFTQGTGTTVVATSNPFTITGLTSSTNYSFYVQADCGGGDLSAWSNAYSAATDCDQTSLPYTENFDSYTGTTYSTAGPAPTCWVTTTTNTSYPAPHIVGSGSYWYHHSGTNSMVFTCGSAGADAYAVLPTFDQPLNSLHLNFWRQMESTSSGTLTVGYVTSANNTSTFVTVATIPSLSGSGDTISVDFTGAGIPANGNIAFHWNYASSYYSCCIDDINVTLADNPGPGTTCDAPTNVNASNVAQTTATITWTPGGDETSWNLQYKAAADANWSSSITVNNTPSYALAGLTANTAYQVRVQAVCDENNVSDWANGTFTTLDNDEPTCPAPTNVEANNITKNSAVITWSQEPNTASSWTVLYKQTVASSWETATSNAMTYTLSGLNPDTQYDVQVMANCDNDMQSPASETIHFTTQPDGVNNYDLDNAISVYPNPTSGQFTIYNLQFTINSVDVYDVYGKLISTTKVEDTQVTLDINTYADGVYFARILTDKGVVTKRIVKK